MRVEILFALTAGIGLASKAFSKCCSNLVVQSTPSDFSVILIVNSLVACVFFFLTGGCSLSVNAVTLLYALVYALIVAVSVVSSTVVYRYASISNVTVVSGSCGMIATALIGGMLFSEEITCYTVLRLAVMAVAILFVFLDQGGGRRIEKKMKAKEKQKRQWIPLVLSVAVITLSGSAATVLLKSFAMSENVVDDTSFFFFTNLLLCVGAAIVYGVTSRTKKEDFRASLRLLKPRKLIFVAGNTVCSNLSSILTVLIVAQMDVSLFSPISSALGILTGVVGSWMFKERQSVFAYIAAVVACVTLFI